MKQKLKLHDGVWFSVGDSRCETCGIMEEGTLMILDQENGILWCCDCALCQCEDFGYTYKKMEKEIEKIELLKKQYFMEYYTKKLERIKKEEK